jgi:hypothetical protein
MNIELLYEFFMLSAKMKIYYDFAFLINSPLGPLFKIREGMTTQPVPPLLQGKRGG